VHGLVTRSTDLQMTNCPISGRGQDHVTHRRISHPWNIFGTAQARVVNFCVLARYVKCQDGWSSLKGAWHGPRDPFNRASICEGGLGSRNSVRPSARLSVTRVDCDKSKWCTADILIPHERAITLLFWYQQWLVGDAPFPLKSALKVTHRLRKTPISTDFRS